MSDKDVSEDPNHALGLAETLARCEIFGIFLNFTHRGNGLVFCATPYLYLISFTFLLFSRGHLVSPRYVYSTITVFLNFTFTFRDSIDCIRSQKGTFHPVTFQLDLDRSRRTSIPNI